VCAHRVTSHGIIRVDSDDAKPVRPEESSIIMILPS